MSVIAKMDIRGVADFGAARAIELSCVCENDLMAEYAGSEEDRLFTRYSPWGEIKLHQPNGFIIGEQGDKVYVMLMRDHEVEDKSFPGSLAFAKARIVSLTDFGDGQAKRVEICSHYNTKETPRIDGFNWKMSVDNPPATAQFHPGKDDYWVAFYPAGLGRDGVIGKAHSPLPALDEDASVSLEEREDTLETSEA